jgi:putative nucleotidyltransferase with HDIG domain
MPDLKEKRVELILQQLQQLPTLPAVAVKVLEATGRGEASAGELAELIKLDPSLTTRVLRLVRRADLGVRGEVTTVDRAVTLLGFEAIRSAVLAVTAMGLFPAEGTNRESRFNREDFWKHSLAAACAAELLAENTPGVDPSEAFVCGLLHDLGKIALDAILPKSYERVVDASDLLRGNIADVERTVVGLDHMVAGKRLAERWQLPAVIRDCIWLHGQSPESLPEGLATARMVNLVTLADSLVREQHLGYSGNYSFHVSVAGLREAAHVTDQAMEQTRKGLIGRIERRAGELGLGNATSGDLYLSALSRANEELGRIGEQLATRNRRLSLRAKYFEALSRFQGELRPDAPAALVLQAIGQTALAVLGCSRVAVFATQPRQSFAEVVVVNAEGELTDTCVVDCPSRLTVPAGGGGPVLPAAESLEWLLGRVSPLLGGEGRFWISLAAEGVCVGGVVWGAPQGEAQRLSPQAQELTALAAGWSLALRTSQFREETRTLTEQLADSHRRLQAAQADLVRGRAMSAVGEMAAGAAHEMNNPLAVISGRAQILAAALEDPKLRQAAQLIHEQSHRLSQIITDLMDFARPAQARCGMVEVADLIERAVYDAQARDQGYARKMETTVAEVPPVMVDGEQVKAALAEVLHNAFQATDETNGLISIHAAFDVFSSRVALTIADNGPGMDAGVLKRAFDPFFSGQRAGRRRGMGLAKALRWIECSGGSIGLESREGQGTRALILLPAAQRAESPAGSAEARSAQG